MDTIRQNPIIAATGYELVNNLTQKTDMEIISIFRARFGQTMPGWALVALGGYGRRDLCPHSDLDLLLLAENKTTRKEIASVLEEILYPLWDKGFNVSYSVRTIKETTHDAREDFFFRTSLIDARFICGSQPCFDKLISSLQKNRFLKNTKKFISDLLFHTKKRHDKFGDTSYILEPELKEGHGGLRDYQTVNWAVRELSRHGIHVPDIINRKDMEELDQAYDFMIKIRYLLHDLSGRKNDRMYLEYQEVLAETLESPGSDVESSVETFMKLFHRNALVIRSITDNFLFSLINLIKPTKRSVNQILDEHFYSAAGQLNFANPGELSENPQLIMDAFRLLARDDYTLGPAARTLIRDSIPLVGNLQNNARAHTAFLHILSSSNARKILTCMLEMGVLEHFIPEFEKIKGRTIFDLYHTYTVDLHSIMSVSILRELQDTQGEIFSRVHNKDVLYLSAFLHDIGKGYGHSHETVGAKIAGDIALRFGFNDEDAGMVRFLVQNHIVMADLATKRDLSEERIVIEFAQKMKDPQRLSMLYLLTVADSMATGTQGWNEWKEALIRELYAKALRIMEKGIFKDPENTLKFEEKWQKLIRYNEEGPGAKYGVPLWSLPQAYILYSDLADIKRHMALRNELKDARDIKVDVTSGGEHITLTIITRDRPGLFSMLTGILAINHLEIISAKVFTWLDGVAVDVFKVIPPWKDFSEWDKIVHQFRDAAAGALDLESKISQIKSLKRNGLSPVSTYQKSSLAINNDTSDFFTLIEVRAVNRLGLLYQVARIISGFGLDIHRAFVSRNTDLCSDVFYVVNEVGEKIEDDGLKQQIAEAINKVIGGSDAKQKNRKTGLTGILRNRTTVSK